MTRSSWPVNTLPGPSWAERARLAWAIQAVNQLARQPRMSAPETVRASPPGAAGIDAVTESRRAALAPLLTTVIVLNSVSLAAPG